MSMTELDREQPAQPQPPERPVVARQRAWRWARTNLFNNWYNSLLTVVLGGVLLVALVFAVRFVFVTARWDIIRSNLTSLMTGLFPRSELWRPWAALYAITIGTGFTVGTARTLVAMGAPEEDPEAGPRFAPREALQRTWPVLVFLAVIIAFSQSVLTTLWLVLLVACAGGAYMIGARMPRSVARHSVTWGALSILVSFALLLAFGGVGWDDWGGLLLTLFLAASGIVLSFPVGVLAALGRRSTFPAVRFASVLYIEFIRGVPLITLLFMGQLMLGLFFPEEITPGLVVRAIIIFTLFTGAYVAEIVRGGLQSVPFGQTEAAQALGLSPTKLIRLVTLPQALRAVIPAMVGQFISLLKDTSLVSIIGLSDLLRVARFQLPAQGDFAGKGLFAETLVFAALVYWVLSYTMSRESQRLEQRLGVGER